MLVRKPSLDSRIAPDVAKKNIQKKKGRGPTKAVKTKASLRKEKPAPFCSNVLFQNLSLGIPPSTLETSPWITGNHEWNHQKPLESVSQKETAPSPTAQHSITLRPRTCSKSYHPIPQHTKLTHQTARLPPLSRSPPAEAYEPTSCVHVGRYASVASGSKWVAQRWTRL